jgi:hypothetical protein
MFKNFTTKRIAQIFILLLLVLSVNSAKSQTRLQDSLALVQFYNGSDGPNWAINNGWLTDPLDDWAGVGLDGNGRVNLLNLNSFGIQTLTNTMPPLTELRNLILDNNTIDENIPSWISGSNFPNLEELSLNNCYFTGDIPSGFSTLNNLIFLNIVNQNFDPNPIPSWLNGTNFPNLEALSLRGTSRTGNLAAYAFMGSLTSLKFMELNGNQFDLGPTPPWMSGLNFPFLEQLYLNEEITDLSNDFVTNVFQELRTLSISFNPNFIENPLVKIQQNSSNFPNLNNIQARQISIDSLPDMSFLTSLTTLEVRDNQLNFEDIMANSSIPNYQYSPQQNFGSTFSSAACPNDIVKIPLDSRKASVPLYEVFRNADTVTVGYTINNDTLYLNGSNKFATWTYRVFDQDPTFFDPSFRLNSSQNIIFEDINCPLTPRQEDSLALVDFYLNAEGTGWTNNSGWLTGPLQSWEGVEIENDRVTKLNLSNVGIPFLPASMMPLTRLKLFDISFNTLSGELIPGWINDSIFPSLKELYIQGCDFQGPIPGSISSLDSLEQLSMGRNFLEPGPIPAWINPSSFPFLKGLDLTYMNRTGSLEAQGWIADFPQLESLMIGGNDFDDTETPSWMYGGGFASTSLQIIDISALNLSKVADVFFSETFNIAALIVDFNPLTVNPVVQLGQNAANFPNFQSISIVNANIDSLPPIKSLMPSLNSISANNFLSLFWNTRNKLRFDDLARATQGGTLFINAQNQDTIGTKYTISVCLGESVKVLLDNGDAVDPGYVIRLNGNVVNSPTLIGDTLIIPAGGFGTWTYTVSELDSGFPYPSFILNGQPIVVFEANYCIDESTSDTLRSPSNPYEAIISKSDGITWEELDSILTNVYRATLKESCLCDGPRLYEFPDTLIDESGVYVGADAVRSRTSATIAAQSIDFFDKNYSMKNPIISDNDNTVWDWELVDLELGEEKVKVMIIDWGIQTNHPYLSDFISTEPTTCPEFENGAVSVSAGLNKFTDELGHGTAMMGIAVTTMNQRNDLLEVLSVKIGDNNTEASLFNTICGLHLADRENVQVVNLSLGYSGEKSELLESYIKKLQTKNTIISTSSGNDGVNLDVLPSENQYWPAYFVTDPTIQNLITVGSYYEDAGTKLRSSFSNYSSQYLSVLAPGNHLWSSASVLISNDLFAPVSGTSASAAVVTGTIASIFSRDAGATIAQVKQTLNNGYIESDPNLEDYVFGGKVLKVNLNIDCIAAEGDKAVNDSAFINTTTTTINVLSNDNYSGAVLIEIFKQPNYGSATVDLNNQIIYTFTGEGPEASSDKIVYKLTDETDSCSYAVVLLSIGKIQDTIGTNYFFSVCLGDTVFVPLNTGDFSEPQIEVYLEGILNSNVLITSNELVIFPNQFGEWNYLLYENLGDSVFVVVRSIFITQDSSCIDEITSDTLRSPSNPYEAIISKSDDITWEKLDSILVNVYGAILKESCLCDGPRLYELPDTLIDESGVYIGADAVRTRTSATIAAQTIDFFDKNYSMKNPVLEDSDNTVWDWEVIDLELGEEKVKVMIIDWGVQTKHPYLSDFISENTTTCPEFDNGVAAVTTVANKYADELGHGTAMAGIAVTTMKQRNDLLEILVVKLGDDSTQATLFGTVCGLHLADKENVKVVNLSLGYSGEKSNLMEDYIKKLQNKNIIISTSAGNEGVDLDELPEKNQYWPAYFVSNPEITNLLTVGSYFEDTLGVKQKSSFSNYSNQYLSVLAPGNHLWSPSSNLVSDELFAPVSGTSASAAMVAGVVASIFSRDMNATISQVKQTLLEEYTDEEEGLSIYTPNGRVLKVNLNIDCIQDEQNTAVNDSVVLFTYSSNEITIDVLANDIFSGEGEITIIKQPTYGTAEVSNNKILYVSALSDSNFVDVFIYKLIDEGNSCSYAIVNINSRRACTITEIYNYTCNTSELGTTTQYFPVSEVCDSIVTTFVLLKPPHIDTINLLTSTPAEVGTVIDTLSTIDGCDSIVVTIISLGQYNDNCQDALEIAVNNSCEMTTYSNAYATGEGTSIAPNPTCGFYSGGDVWFKLEMPASGAIRIERQNISGVNAQFALYSGVCGAFVQLTCAQLDAERTYINPALAGEEVYLRVFNYGSSTGGTFSLCVWEPEISTNNNCADALTLNVGTTCVKDTFTNRYANGEPLSIAPDPSCGFYRGGDIWFKLKMPESGNIRIERTNISGVNAQFALYSGGCGTFTELFCAQLDDDRTYINSSLAGDSLYLRVYNYGSEEGGEFSLCVWEPEVSTNNNCAEALTLNVNSSCVKDTFSNRFADGEPLSIAQNPSCGFYRGGDVWFKLKMPESGNLRIERTNISGVNAQFALYSGGCGTFTELFCAQLDDDRTYINSSLAGDSLYLRVYNYGSEEGGEFSICAWEPPIPVNDNCSNAIPLPLGDVCSYNTYTNAYAASIEPENISHPSCGFFKGGDVWFTVRMPSNGKLKIQRTNISGVNAQFAIYSGICGSLAEEACAQLTSELNLNNISLAGQTLYIRVWNYNTEEGGIFNFCAFNPECVTVNSTINYYTCDENEVNSTLHYYTSLNGCDSVVTIITELLPSSEVTINLTTCKPSEAGTVVDTLTKANGCDSVVTIITELLPSKSSTVEATTCNPAQVGTTYDTLTASNGCDSVVTTITTLVASYDITINATTCDPSEAGSVTETFIATTGCDSVVTIITELLPSSEVTINLTTCTPSEAGTVVDTLTKANGCDSVVAIITELLPSKSSTVEATTCNPAQVGTTYDTLTASNGCDSVVTTIATLIASYDITINATTCDSSEAGSVTETFIATTGCDSVVTIITELLPSSEVTINLTTCTPSEAGTVVDTLTKANGCDSVVTIITELLPSKSSTVEATTCNPAQVGTTYDTLTASNGCDSVVTTITTLVASYDITINATTCDPSEAGSVTETYTANTGCDSVVTIITELLPSTSSTVEATSCDPLQVGTTIDTLVGSNGCDSIVITNTTLIASYDITINATTCDPSEAGSVTETYIANTGCDSIVTTITTLIASYDITINATTCNPSEAGSVTETYIANTGCDSVVTIITELLPSKTSTLEATTCNPAQVGTTYDTLTASNGCDSVVTTITTLVASYDITINATTCDPSEAGSVTETYTANTGCDSVVTIITELLPSTSSTVEATSCDPLQVGTTIDTLVGSNGCDSIVITNTTLIASYDITINATTCDPSEAGSVTETYTANTGCDSA